MSYKKRLQNIETQKGKSLTDADNARLDGDLARWKHHLGECNKYAAIESEMKAKRANRISVRMSTKLKKLFGSDKTQPHTKG